MWELTLWQPWASLIAHGHKQVETRAWGTKHRGPLAIHAAKRPMGPDERWLLDELEHEFGIVLPDVPLGAVVATANLAACDVMTQTALEAVDEVEYRVGDWGIGRYAWRLSGVKRLEEPVPAVGRQLLWRWQVPA